MYIVPIAWLYVTLMMALAEANDSNGTVLGAVITFVLYGVLPVTLVVYLMRTPTRRKALRARERGEEKSGAASSSGKASLSVDPDAGGHAAAAAPGDGVAPVRKES